MKRQDRTLCDFPAIRQQYCRFHIFKDYEPKRKEQPVVVSGGTLKPLGRTTFTKVVTALTQGQQQRTQYLDYMIRVLLYDNINVIVRMVQNEVVASHTRKILLAIGVVDAHFAVAMRHLNHYVNETQNNIIAPSDVLNGLSFNDGIGSHTAELISIIKGNLAISKWMDSKKRGALAPISRVNKIEYEDDGEGCIAKAYAYIGEKPIRYQFMRHSSRVIEHGQEENDPGDQDDEADATCEVACMLQLETRRNGCSHHW